MPIRSVADGPASSDTGNSESQSGRGRFRLLVLLALGVGALVYVLSKYVDLPGVVPSTEDVRERAPTAEAVREQTSEAVPDDFQEIPVGGRGDDESSAAAFDDSTSPEDVTEGVDDAETAVDMTDEERSAEEIAERADEEVPEPGEMAVDDAVADELLGDEDDELEGDES
ncbi:hypothetical protein [Natrarchaeobaculum sulfurireducens]|uniref:hypothetical protein n=1 Tax=Natrarchaeobaculum sulfurireducens TaxID=2044521 RepID=UPI000E3CF256|nr:hypothetical protein [Natrarchaeobaculum sulfurireducens]